MQVFGHSGDIGDIIYSLPTIRAAGGGELVLFNYPGRTYQPMTEDRCNRLRPLLEYQDYISAVTFSETPRDTSLNGFRDHKRHGNTADCHLATHGLGWEHRQKAWLKVPYPIKTHRVIMAWTHRHHSFEFPWKRVVDHYAGEVGFLGYSSDHKDFCEKYGVCPDFVPADDFMTIAQIVRGSELFVGNLTSITAVAEGLKHKMIVEAWHSCPANDFVRFNSIIAYTDKFELP